MDILHRLEETGIRIINPARSIEKAVDKFYTSALLEEAGIKTPRTIVTEKYSDAIEAFKELGGDIVLKPLFGSLGKGMTRITCEDIAYRIFRTLERIDSVYYVQEFIPNNGEDIRVFTIGDRVVASMKRISDNWKTNISTGGKPEIHYPSKKVQEISIRASELLGLDYSGVDLIIHDSDVYVIELNSTPGWKGLQSVTDTDITNEIVNYVISVLR